MVNSTYRTAYRTVNGVREQLYQQNLGYRKSRRLNEFQHNQSAFCWDAQEWEKPSQTSVVSEPREGESPSFKYKHNLFNKLYKVHHPESASHSSSNNKKQVSSKTETSECKSNPTVIATESKSSPAILHTESKSDNHSAHRKKNKVVQQQVKNEYENCSSKKTKKTRPSDQTKTGVQNKRSDQYKVFFQPKKSEMSKKMIPKKKSGVSQKSAPASLSKGRAGRHGTAPEPTRPKSPFVMYGYKDREEKVAPLMTFNVLASSDIYPSALRAKAKRHLERLKREFDKAIDEGGPLPFYNAKSYEENDDDNPFAKLKILEDNIDDLKRQFGKDVIEDLKRKGGIEFDFGGQSDADKNLYSSAKKYGWESEYQRQFGLGLYDYKKSSEYDKNFQNQGYRRFSKMRLRKDIDPSSLVSPRMPIGTLIECGISQVHRR